MTKTLLCFSLVLGLVGCGDGAVNLRTIKAEAGTELAETFSVVMDGDVEMKVLGETAKGEFEFTTRSETDYEIGEVADGLLVEWTEKLRKEVNTNRFVIGGNEEIEREDDVPLLGVLVRMTILNDKVSAEILDVDRPTPEQVAELKELKSGAEYEM